MLSASEMTHTVLGGALNLYTHSRIMLTGLQGHFTIISSKVQKLLRKRERSVSTAVATAGQTMTETDLGEIYAVTVRFGVGQLPTDCSIRISKSVFLRCYSRLWR